ncbi:DUF4214 domain-containing protein [Massilia timonae]|uniref:DUF4214 domain-containing protein n=1 Tax=Massilia timonae TaxID=47229 RepID=UPI001E47EDEB|nr:DUF4214 domain-containing protein [Massilia timonae]
MADTREPLILSVTPPLNDTYAIGETLRFTVTFDEDIIVTGTDSRLELNIGGSTQYATFVSAPTSKTIIYSYTVKSGDLDADGITVGALSAGTGTIRDAAGNPADLTLNNVGATAGVRVDGVAPAITGTITPPANGTYVAGSNLDFTVTFDENVTITGTSSTLGLTIGNTAVFATHLSQTANSITYRYVVQSGNLDADGITIGGLTLPDGNTIRDAAGNNADVSLDGHLPPLAGVRVDAVAPAVLGYISAPIADSYRAGDVLTFNVTFNENIAVTLGGAPSTLGLTIGSTARSASYVTSDTNSVTYSYTVQAGDNDADGIGIGSIALGGMTIRDAAGNNAVLSLTGHLPSTTGILVDTTAPAVSGNISVPGNGSYRVGQHLDFTVSFDENVTVDGTDSTLGLTIGGELRSAIWLSDGGNTVTYRYTVQAGDLDADGIQVHAIVPGSSTFRDAAGNDANLSLVDHLPSTSAVLVDGVAPTISGTISAPTDRWYSVGDELLFTVTFDEDIAITGTASTLTLDVGGVARQAVHDTSNGNSIIYRYVVQSGDNDGNGIDITSLALNGSSIRDQAGNNANLTLTGHLPVLTGVLVDGSAPSISAVDVPQDGYYRAGDVLSFTVTFDEDVIVDGDDSMLNLTIGATARNATFDSSTANSITYTYTVQTGDNDANGIAIDGITPGSTTIRDAAGNHASLSMAGGLPPTTGVIVDTMPPSVSGNMSVPANATYVAGQILEFKITFNEDITVSGNDSTLGLTIGGAARSASFHSADGGTVTYRYTVQAGDVDADGIDVGAIDPGLGSFRDAAGNDADLSLSGHVPPTSQVLVDGTVPSVTGIDVPGDRWYSLGQVLEFTVNFDENVTVFGSASTLELDIGGTSRSATYSSSIGHSVTYRYTVQASDNDADGINVAGLALNGSTIRDAAGNDANLMLTGHVPPLTDVLVDGGPPAVSGNIEVPEAGSYRAGQVLNFTLKFSENVTVVGQGSELALDIGGAVRHAGFVSSAGDSVTYSYTVQAGDTDANGIEVGAIVLNGATIRDAAGNDANLALDGHLPSTADVLIDTTAPAVAGAVTVPLPGTYVAGQTLDFVVSFDENVTVDGDSSTLGLTIGAAARSAAFLSAAGNTVTYRYIVQAGDLDANGIDVGAIVLGSSTIRDAAGNDAVIALAGHLPPTTGILVDGTVPVVSGTIGAPGDKTYTVGETLTFTVTFSENVTVTGANSTLGLDIGGAARSAVYESKSANSVTYSYTVQAGDNDADGIEITGLALNGGAIRDAAGNNADLALAGHLPSLTDVLVDGDPPAVSGNIEVPEAGSYRVGQVLNFTLKFSENVTVVGQGSELALDIGGAVRHAGFVASAGDSVTYSYTVQAGDTDANGIEVGGIVLNGATIRDAAGNDANLALDGHLPSTANVLIDTTAPAVAGAVTAPLPGTYVAGQSLDFVVSFDENVTVDGDSSTLGLTIGAAARSAAFLSAAGNTVTYRYIVQAGDLDADGIDVGAITLGSSTIRDAAGNDAVIELAGHLPSTTGILVDGTVPVVSGTIAAPGDKTYTVGETLTFTVTFSENVTVTGASSTLGLDIGGAARSAVYESKTANSITYSYTVQAGDNDADGIEITGLALNGGAIRDAAGNNADLALAGHLPPLDAVRVDTAGPILTTATVDGNSMVLSFADAGALDATHPPALGDFTVTVAGETVTVTGVTVDASAKTVTLTLSTAVRNGQAVTVAYDDLTPNDANAIQDAVGNDAASFGVTPVVNNTPAPPTNPPTNPPATGNTVDGVTLQIGTVVRSDGTVAQVVTVPIVTPSRQEQVGNNNVADIPLVKAADGSSLLAVQVPTGAGLQSIGNGAPKRAGDSLTDLIREIQAHTASGSHDQNQLTGGGGGFLDILDADTQLLVQTIVLGGTGGTADVPLGIIGQPQQAGAVQSALVIDARSLSSAATIELQHVNFAAIIGAATVTGGAGNQHVWGDGSSQTIILGEGDDVLHGGAGDDIIGSGAGDDMIYGDEGDDLVFGGEGNDYLDGGTGHDTARFSGAVDGYSLRLKDGLLVMTDRAGNDGVDTVAAVEVLRFTGGQSMADDAVLARLYEGVLGRQASAAEVAWWQDVHVRGASLQQIAAAIIDSPEAAQAMGRADDDAFVAGLYQSVLGRTAPSAESAFWTDLLADGVDRATVALGFVNSAEKLASSLDVDFNHSDVAVLTRMYHAMFGRAPDEGGLNFWLERHEDGVSLGAIADEFIVSAEAQGLAGHGSDAAFIDQLFATALNRAPSSEEKTLLLEHLQNGVYDRGQVLLDVSESEESIVIVGAINTSIDLL